MYSGRGRSWVRSRRRTRAPARAPPHVRYAFACAALVGLAALLPLNLATLEVPEAPAAQALPAQRIADTDAVAPPSAWTDSSPEIARDEASTPVLATAAPEAHEMTRDERPRAASRAWYDPALPWIGRAWFAGLLLFALYDVLGLIAVRRLRKQACPVGPALLELAEALRARMGIRATVRIRVVEGLSSALVTGFFRVVVLVPASMVTGMAPRRLSDPGPRVRAHPPLGPLGERIPTAGRDPAVLPSRRLVDFAPDPRGTRAVLRCHRPGGWRRPRHLRARITRAGRGIAGTARLGAFQPRWQPPRSRSGHPAWTRTG